MDIPTFQALQDAHTIKHNFDAPFAPNIVEGLKLLVSKDPNLIIEAQTENLLAHGAPPFNPAWADHELLFMLDHYWLWFPAHGWIIGTG